MRFGQFAIAASAEPKWLLNSAAILGRSIRLTPENARWWGLVRVLESSFGLGLTRAASAATRALSQSNDGAEIIIAGDIAGSVKLVVELARYDTAFLANLSRARVRETPKRRGRRARAPKDPISAAEAYGIDIGLLQASLKRSPAERLELLERNNTFVSGIQRGLKNR